MHRVAMFGRYGTLVLALCAASVAGAGASTTNHDPKFFSHDDGIEKPFPSAVIVVAQAPNAEAVVDYCRKHGIPALMIDAECDEAMARDAVAGLLERIGVTSSGKSAAKADGADTLSSEQTIPTTSEGSETGAVPFASPTCPRCGVDSPHTHDGVELASSAPDTPVVAQNDTLTAESTAPKGEAAPATKKPARGK